MKPHGFTPLRGLSRLPKYVVGFLVVRVCHGVWPSRDDVRAALTREFFPLYYEVTRGGMP